MKRGLSEGEALASLSRAAPPAAWHAADSFTAFTGNGIKSLLSYQHGSLASCRKSNILGGTEVELERISVAALPCSGLGVFLETLRQLPVTYYYYLFFICLLFHWMLSNAFHLLTKNLCCPSYFCQFQREQVGHLGLGIWSVSYTLLEHIWQTALYLDPVGPFSRDFQERFKSNPRIDHLCPFFHYYVLYCTHFFFPWRLSLKSEKHNDGHIHNMK